jgi:hypothetical protein
MMAQRVDGPETRIARMDEFNKFSEVYSRYLQICGIRVKRSSILKNHTARTMAFSKSKLSPPTLVPGRLAPAGSSKILEFFSLTLTRQGQVQCGPNGVQVSPRIFKRLA